ncbi:Exodeoxyribonuclease 7 small subunit [Cedecea neteri]|uniref:Exodeoxyribonuclease 7 small subunit n=1 Tax=Cedecea neteri TaxID=158822 RepID=A0A2X2TCI0_9ENTR|nr:Exodeoxyribonuclease 7 small subunit [Cedecea neteri]
MPKKTESPASFETALVELEQIVTRLESGDLALEEALNEFERGVAAGSPGASETPAGRAARTDLTERTAKTPL